ncbi:MAG: Mur ligase family protein [Bdellovibrionales bacterium]
MIDAIADILIPVAALALAVFCFRRLPRYLHFYQQDEYDSLRLLRWWWSHQAMDSRATAALLPALLLYVLAPVTRNWDYAIIGGLYHMFLMPLVLVAIAVHEGNPARYGKKPLAWTARARRIFILAFVITLVLLAVAAAIPDRMLQMGAYAVIIQLLPFTLMIGNMLLAPYESTVQRAFRRDAEAKLKKLNPKIIGITGSFGKTSTKHILNHILGSVAPTLATPGSVNTLMGITRIIREQLKPEHKFFIVEMGAYGPGSIERLCDFTPPVLSAITAVGAAHYERYKTIDQVAKAKFAIADAAWKNGGVTIINATQVAEPYIQHYVRDPARTRLITGTPQPGAYYLNTVQQTASGLAFRLQMPDGLMADFQTPLFGTQHAANCAVAVVLALECGVPLSSIQMALVTTPQIKHRLEVKRDGLPYTMVDDAYNSNAAGFEAALDVLDLLGRHQNGERIVITPGMVEMGDLHDSEHKRLGLLAAQKADRVIIVASERIPTFLEGVRIGGTRVDEVATLAEARALIENATKNDVILFENDLPDLYESRATF